jgi:hypothetical protein
MANLKFTADTTVPDDKLGSIITVENRDIDYLGDIPDIFYTYLHAMGYTFVDSVIITTEDGKEFSSL